MRLWTLLCTRTCLFRKIFQLLVFFFTVLKNFNKFFEIFRKNKKNLKYFWIDIYHKPNKRLKQPLKFKLQMAPSALLICILERALDYVKLGTTDLILQLIVPWFLWLLYMISLCRPVGILTFSLESHLYCSSIAFN